MSVHKMLIDTVELFNYVGEVNDEASYQKTVFSKCYCPLDEGAALSVIGRTPIDGGKLYLFDMTTKAKDGFGNPVSYLPFPDWNALADKTGYWTLSDKGTDYFVKAGSANKLRINSFSRKKTGSRKMWHFEVVGV
ncbi:MAG: hypothetical protein II897_03930 [Clostridia bacterium]|nr:hypothetical protein [Clostridia bacterium]